jgi:hypothetical protein
MRGLTLEELVAKREAEWGGVKRDMEVVRAVLRHIEDRTDLAPRRVTIPGLDDDVVQAHVWMLHAEGMLNTTNPSHPLRSAVPEFKVRDLTWQGHELAAVLSETSWARMKGKLSPVEMAGMSLKALLEVGTALGAAWAKGKLGLSD